MVATSAGIPHKPAFGWLRVRGPEAAFAARTVAAALLAFYIALAGALQEPHWAAMTVFIVAQADRGMTVAKGRNRIAGTLLGALVALALTAAFAAAPELLVLALAVWLSGCTALAIVLSSYRSYAAVLAGYSAVIITMGAAGHPQHVFDVAVARSSNIVIGIVVEGVLGALLMVRTPLDALAGRFEDYLRQSQALCVRLLRGEPAAAQIQRFFVTALQFNESVRYAAAAAPDIAHRAGRIRRASQLTLAGLVAAQALHDDRDPALDADPTLAAIIALLERRAAGQALDRAGLAGLRRSLHQQRRLAISAALPERVHQLRRLDMILACVAAADTEHRAFLRGRAADRRIPGLANHRDWTLAWHGALRTLLAMLAAGLFWFASAWTSGAGLMTIVGVVCALYASRPDPVAGGMGFLKGAAWAALVAGVCDALLMPHVSDFVSLALLLGPLLFVAGVAMRRPASAAVGTSFAIFVLDLIAPRNGGYADVLHLFNGGLALLMGIAIGVAMFALVLPDTPLAKRRRLRQAVRRDLLRIAAHPHRWSNPAWFSRMADRMRHQLGGAARLPPEQLERDLAELLAALLLGAGAIALARHAGRLGEQRALLRRLQRLDLEGFDRTTARLLARLQRRALAAHGAAARALWHEALLVRDMQLAARGLARGGDGLLQRT